MDRLAAHLQTRKQTLRTDENGLGVLFVLISAVLLVMLGSTAWYIWNKSHVPAIEDRSIQAK